VVAPPSTPPSRLFHRGGEDVTGAQAVHARARITLQIWNL